MDYSKLSDSTLMNLISINQQESGGAGASSTITNPTSGAKGNMQVVDSTAKKPGYGVRPSDGTPEDTSREGAEYYSKLNEHYKDPVIAAMAYNWGPGNVDKWQAAGSDYSKVPDETLKYALKQHSANQSFQRPQQPQAQAQGQSAANQRGMAALQAMRPDMSKIGPAVTGTGEMAASMASGMFGQAAGLLHGAADLATGSDYHTAKGDFQKETNAVTYQPRTPEGQDITEKAGQLMDQYMVQPMRQGAQAAMGAIPFVGGDLAKSPLANEIAGDVGEGVANVAPMFLGAHEIAKKPGGMAVKDVGAASELDKLNALYDRQEPTMGPNSGPQQPMPPNAGPQRPPISVNSQGIAVDPLGNPDMSAFVEQGNAHQAVARGDFFGDNSEGLASPFNPNRLSSEVQEPFVPANPTNLRQGSLDFDAARPPELLHSDSLGDTGTPSQMRDMVPFRDEMTQRVEKLNAIDPQQLSLLDEGAHLPPDAGTRSLSVDEFHQTVASLAEKDGTRFPYPEDLENAYNKYLDTVKNEQGQLFSSGDLAKSFAENVRNDAMLRRIQDHPVVARNQALVDRLLADKEAAGGKTTPAGERALEQAQVLLEKSQKNIGKALGKDPLLPWEKDGVVNMFTFGHMPELWKSIKAVLQALHGMTFKMINKALPSFKNLDSTGKVIGQALKDAANAQANKKWDTQSPVAKVLKGVDGLREGLKDYLPFESRELSPEQLKAQMQGAPDLSAEGGIRAFMRDNFLTGQQLQAFTHHPLVKYAVETVDRAMRNSHQYVREALMGKDGLRNSVRQLSDDEFATLWHVMQQAEGQKEFTPSELKHAGFTDKQIEVYTKMREADKQNLADLNRGRATAGLAPIDARIAHIAGHFLGDFKQVITDKEGKVVAVIAHNLKLGVKTITKRVMDQLGDGYTAGPIEMRKLSEGNHTDRYTGYMNILNDMAGRDEVVSKVMQAYRDYLTQDSQTAMKYRAAFKQKEGVIGAEGRKSWESQKSNAQNGMKNFLRAQEAMHSWANMQEALSKIGKFTSDAEIDAPNAKLAVQNYLDNVQHRNQGSIADGVNGAINAVASATGIGPSILKGTTSKVKTGLLTWFIGVGKLSHSFVTLIQPLQGIPVVNAMMRAEGSKLGLHQLSAVFKSLNSQKDLLGMIGKKDLPNSFEGRAMKFARENDTFNTTQFKFGNLTDIDRSRLGSNLHTAAEFNVTGMEAGTRAFTFMYYSHMLRELGMPEKEIFTTAHNAMRDVMVDYNSWERPGIFGKTGFLGDLTAMLTRYKFNQIDQFVRAGKYAKEGKITPLLTVMSTAALFAGARGLMAYSLANSAVSQISKWMAENNMITKPTSLDEMLLHMLHGKNEDFSNMVKFGVPAGLGLNMTGSLSHADDIPSDPIGALVPQSEPLQKYGEAAYGFLHDPNKQTAKAALYGLAPNSLRGPLENLMFTDKDGNYKDPSNNTLRTKRTEADQTKRAFSFRPLNEANESLTTQVDKDQAAQEAAVRQDITQKLLHQFDSHGAATPEQWKAFADKYVANHGDPRELQAAYIKHAGLDQKLTAAQRAQGIPRGSLQGAMNYKRYEELK